ncbi:MAG: outer membrane lipoprotein carrier protein LolA [Elusimicrobia bacterium]|nr:outer membrane lipoprotein carrier protein LolA [Elusimicrobiota bacterium]
MRRAAFVFVFLAPSLAWSASSAAKEKAKKPAPGAHAKAPGAGAGLPLLPPPTGPITVELVTKRFEEFDLAVNTLSADFRQVVRWDESGVQQAVEGSLEFHKPNLLRIEHRLPENQTIVADGIWLWVWRKDNNQVVQTKLEDWKKSEPVAQGLLDFGNYAQLLKTYEVSVGSVSAPGADGHRAFDVVLRPKEKSAPFTLTMRVSTADFFPTQTELRVGGVLVRSIFSALRYNPELAESRFQFTPPADADVFQNFKPPRTE